MAWNDCGALEEICPHAVSQVGNTGRGFVRGSAELSCHRVRPEVPIKVRFVCRRASVEVVRLSCRYHDVRYTCGEVSLTNTTSEPSQITIIITQSRQISSIWQTSSPSLLSRRTSPT